MNPPTALTESEIVLNRNGERVISADSHVAITQDQIKANLATRWHAAYDEAQQAFAAAMAANMAQAKVNMDAMTRNQHAAFTRPGYGDGPSRLADMDTDGIDVEVIYSEVSAFRYIRNMREGIAEATRAFNDVLTEFASADPRRLIVNYQIPINDIPTAIAEVQRVAADGAKALQIPVFPTEIGQPDYYDERYAPLWDAIGEVGLPLACHIGVNTNLDDLTRRDPTAYKGVMVPMAALSTAEAFGMWILGGVLERHPDLQLVFVEPGLGWIAWYLDIIDDMVLRQGYSFEHISDLPSTYFHRNIAVTFIDEPDALTLLRHKVGVDNMLWSTDFPHPVTSWPDSQDLIERAFADIPADDKRKIICDNAARIWRL
jgi:predicted TIM-barrel fold metal-dependent hydrolase